MKAVISQGSEHTTGIVTGSQQNATGGTAFSDNMAGSGGGEDAILPDQ